jgi:hypothetical protein
LHSLCRPGIQLAQALEGCIQTLAGFNVAPELPQRVGGAGKRAHLDLSETRILPDFR